MRNRFLLMFILLLALFLLGCGGTKKDTTSTSSGSPQVEETQGNPATTADSVSGTTSGKTSATDPGELKMQIEKELDALDGNLQDINNLGGGELDKGF